MGHLCARPADGDDRGVSVDSSGVQGNGQSYTPSISGDGRYVAFYSTASNLVSGDTNNVYDAFVHDRQTGTTSSASVDSSGVQGNGQSYIPSISGDGHYVAFYSTASNLVSGDTNGTNDTFVKELDNAAQTDTDGDGVADNGDNCPNDANADQLNTDGDALGDACDTNNNDGPLGDLDGDGITNAADTNNNDGPLGDLDGDGVNNANDAFPNDPTETIDSDGDGVGDNSDAFPNDPTETADSDGDGVGDNSDAFPNDPDRDGRQ